ncbi:MAG: site-specific integrase [Anaeromyxobacteraceae bacterium]
MVEGKSTRRPRVRRLTEGWLREQLGKKRAAREEWGDTDKPGLRVRFGKSGAISWVHYKQAGGKQTVIILGRYPDLSLRAAHQRLDEERSRARQGMTGVESRHADYGEMTVADLVDRFVGSLKAHRKHPEDAKAVLRRYILDRAHGFKDLKVRTVARPAWHAIVEEIAAEGYASQAIKVHALLGQMFVFAAQLGILEASPFQGLRARSLGAVEKPPRQRVLSPSELRTLLTFVTSECALNAKVGRLGLHILILTGKRTGETVLSQWRHFDLEAALWTIPEANRKAPLNAGIGDEVVPLSPQAVRVLWELHGITGSGIWAFRSPIKPSTHINDSTLSRVVSKEFEAARFKGAEWTPHDLRRTARTYWREKLGVPWDLSERMLGHSLPKVARTYDVGTYLDQRREALTRWADYLDRLASGEEAKVVDLAAAKVGGR